MADTAVALIFGWSLIVWIWRRTGNGWSEEHSRYMNNLQSEARRREALREVAAMERDIQAKLKADYD